MRADHAATDMGRSIVIEVFNLTFRGVASEQGIGAAFANRELSCISFTNRSALFLESINTSIICSNCMARTRFDTCNRRNFITRNDSLSIKLGLGGAATIGTGVRRGIIATGGEDGSSAESGNKHEFFHFISFESKQLCFVKMLRTIYIFFCIGDKP